MLRWQTVIDSKYVNANEWNDIGVWLYKEQHWFCWISFRCRRSVRLWYSSSLDLYTNGTNSFRFELIDVNGVFPIPTSLQQQQAPHPLHHHHRHRPSQQESRQQHDGDESKALKRRQIRFTTIQVYLSPQYWWWRNDLWIHMSTANDLFQTIVKSNFAPVASDRVFWRRGTGVILRLIKIPHSISVGMIFFSACNIMGHLLFILPIHKGNL